MPAKSRLAAKTCPCARPIARRPLPRSLWEARSPQPGYLVRVVESLDERALQLCSKLISAGDSCIAKTKGVFVIGGVREFRLRFGVRQEPSPTIYIALQ